MSIESEPRRTETLLIVDDDEALTELVQRMVEREGYNTLVAHNVKTAIELFEANREVIDLVVTDLVMSGEEGRALAFELMRSRPGVRILVSTGLHSDAVQELLDAGVKGVVFKPYQSATLLAKIREAIET